MKKTLNVILAGIMALLCCSVGKAQINYSNVFFYQPQSTLIYSNAFNGSAVNIWGTPANYEAGVLGGAQGSNWVDLRGLTDTNAFYANGTVGTEQNDVISLPITPQSNVVYTLKAQVTLSGNPGTWVAAGYEAYDTTNLSYPSHYAYNGNGGWNFAILNFSGNTEYFGGESTANPIYNATPAGVGSAGTYTFTFILDGTSNRWVGGGFILGTAGEQSLGSHVYGLPPSPLAGVSIGQNGTESAPQDITWDNFTLVANQVLLLQQPAPLANLDQGYTFSDSVVAGGCPTNTYQWYTNGVPLVNGGEISGATNATLTFNPLQPQDAATNLYCVVTNIYGAVTSSPTVLNVYTTPTVVSANPITYTNVMTLFGGSGTYYGSTPNFTIQAGGLLPLTYFWLTNGVPATAPVITSTPGYVTFSFTNCQMTSPTNFSCIASNSLGTVTNTWLALYIPTPTAPYPQMLISNQPVAYWRLDETNSDPNQYNDGQICDDFMSGNNGFYTNVELYQPGYFAIGATGYVTNDPTETSVDFGPTDFTTGDNVNSIGTNIDFSSETSAEFSVSCWANGGYLYSSAEPANGGIVVKGYFGTEEFALDDGGSGGSVRFMIRTAANAIVQATSTYQLGGNNQWYHLVGVCDESNGVVNLYVNGLLAGQAAVATNAGVLAEPTAPIAIGENLLPGEVDGGHQFDGALDDVSIFNKPLSALQVNALYAAAGGVNPLQFTAPLPPTNAVWRLSSGAGTNANLVINATALGNPPLGYYWTNLTTQTRVSGTFVNGGSGSSPLVSTLNCSVTITDAPPTMSGDILELVVTNATSTTNWFTTLFAYPLPVTIGYTNSILFSNQFDGGTWAINGSGTTLANQLVGGTNSTWIDCLGVNDTAGQNGTTPVGIQSDGFDNSTLGDSWILPFTPHAGYVYTLNASAYMTAFTGSSWIGAGFAGPVTNNAVGAARFADADIYGYDFIIWVNTSGNVQYFMGPGAALYITNVNNFYPIVLPQTITAQVVLDTTGPQWVEYAYLNGVFAGTNTFPTIPPIGSIGLTQTTISDPNNVTWTNFSLTAVAPGGIPPYLYVTPSANPVSVTNTTVALNATAFGSAPMGYYWINNSTVLTSGVTNTPVPSVPNNAAPIVANISVPGSSLSAGTLDLVVTNAYGTNITAITVTSPAPASPGPIAYHASNGIISLSWSASDIGYYVLQAQTNSVTTGIAGNWVNVSGSASVNQETIPVNLTNGTVFYRLAP